MIKGIKLQANRSRTILRDDTDMQYIILLCISIKGIYTVNLRLYDGS